MLFFHVLHRVLPYSRRYVSIYINRRRDPSLLLHGREKKVEMASPPRSLPLRSHFPICKLRASVSYCRMRGRLLWRPPLLCPRSSSCPSLFLFLPLSLLPTSPRSSTILLHSSNDRIASHRIAPHPNYRILSPSGTPYTTHSIRWPKQQPQQLPRWRPLRPTAAPTGSTNSRLR